MASIRSRVKRVATKRAENLLYRMGGLPITLRALLGQGEGTAFAIRRAYAARYWHPRSPTDAAEILIAILLWPWVVTLGAAYLTARNGRIIQQRCGRPAWRQFLDQLWFAGANGVLPPWYYIFALHDGERARRAHTYLNRCETKRGAYPLLRALRHTHSDLGDKSRFAETCRSAGLPTASVLAVAERGTITWLAAPGLPATDLFVKPVNGCGGKQAERWDHAGEDRYRRTDGLELTAAALVERLQQRGTERPMLVQPRLVNHPALRNLSNGALTTVRVLTCLDEQDRPEVVGAVCRMAIGTNRTVDNLHAGGIASRIDIRRGEMSKATNLGVSAALGWLDLHPDTRAPITGRIFPLWEEVRALAERAHAVFRDHVFVGWDIALLPDGPCLVEANSGPDVDIMQRHSDRGLCSERFGALLAWHLAQPAVHPPEPARRPASAGLAAG